MKNNTLCDILGCLGCFIVFISLVLIFFGVNCWITTVAGITLAIFALYEYDYEN